MGVATAVAVAGVAASAYGAYSSNQQAGRSRNAQQRMHDEQMGLARDQMQFGQEHYDWSRGLHDEYRERFDPVLGELTDEAMASRTPDYGLITADTTAAFNSARMADQRNLERYGIRPGDGQWGANNRRYGIGQATAEVGARQQARRQAGDQRFARLAQLYGVGMGLQGQAMQGMGQGMGAFQSGSGMGVGAAGQQAGHHGQMAGYHGQMAYENMRGVGQGIGGMVDHFMNQPSTPAAGGTNFWAPTTGSYSVPGLPGQGNININRPGGP